MFEYVGLFFSFLWFHRGIVVAAVLLWGLFRVLTVANDRVVEKDVHNLKAPVYVPMTPKVVINKVPERDKVTERRAARTVPLLPSEPMPLDRPAEKRAIEVTLDPKTARFNRFVESANVDSLFRRFVGLMKEVPQVGPLEAVGNMNKCRQICKRLRERELTVAQEERLSTMELEAVSQLDAINVQHNMQIAGLRGQLMEVATKLQRHPAVSVSSKAHLAVFAARAIDLMFGPTREKLGSLTNAYQASVDGVMRGENEVLVMADLLRALIDKHQFEDVIVLRRDLANRMLNDSNIDLTKMDWTRREQIVFGDLELRTLIGRLDGVDESAMQDVDLFYRRLERFPDSRKQIFQVAMALIDKSLINEQFDQASGLLAVLQRIQSETPDEEIRAWFGESLSGYPEKIRAAQLSN